MTKKSSNVLIRSEHESTVEKKDETYGLSVEEYTKFYLDLEACRNDKGQWDYFKVLKFAQDLTNFKEVPGTVPFNKYETPVSEMEMSKMVKKYFKDHDPLKINPWAEDDDKKSGKN